MCHFVWCFAVSESILRIPYKITGALLFRTQNLISHHSRVHRVFTTGVKYIQVSKCASYFFFPLFLFNSVLIERRRENHNKSSGSSRYPSETIILLHFMEKWLFISIVKIRKSIFRNVITTSLWQRTDLLPQHLFEQKSVFTQPHV